MRQHCRLLAFLFSIPSLLFAQAQVSSGDLTGTIMDPKGAAIPSARIIASASERGVTRTAESDSTGQYRIALLPPGSYRVRVEAQGFRTRVLEGVAVQVGETFAKYATRAGNHCNGGYGGGHGSGAGAGADATGQHDRLPTHRKSSDQPAQLPRFRSASARRCGDQ